ncbi:hypothetical protein DFAR_620013 [Desulfarculales bacterium]
MVRVASLFSQLLHHFPRTEFSALVKKHGTAVRTKGFSCWTQFVALLFYHPPGPRTDSLRESCPGLSCCLGKLSHLEVNAAPKKVHPVLRQPCTNPRPCSEPYASKPWNASVPKATWAGKRAT